MGDKAGCIINPLTNRAVKTSTKLGKRLIAEATNIENEIKAGKLIKAAAKRALAKKPEKKDDYKYLEVLNDDELGEALMHYYRKNTSGDALWSSFLTKSRSRLMETIKKNNIKLSVKKPLDQQPTGPDPTKK